MAKKKPFLLRLPPDLLEALRRWSDDEMRSLNGHIEYLLRAALRARRRLPDEEPEEGTIAEPPGPAGGDEADDERGP